MYRLIVVLLAAVLALPAFATEIPKPADAKVEDRKTLYSVGYLILARQLSVLDLSAEELEAVKQGLSDGITGKAPAVDVELYKTKIQPLAVSRLAAQRDKMAAQAKPFMEKALKEKGAVQTASGLIYRSLRDGTGVNPAAGETVKVNYRGTLIDGKEFDSSYAVGKPAEFQLNRVIKCWTEGVQMMKVGGKAHLVCPPDIAYGERGSGKIPPNSTIVFDVELLEIVKPAGAKPAATIPVK